MRFHCPGQTPQLLVRFNYDEASNLTAVYDALNAPYRYVYRNNLLVKHTDRNGLSFYYEYDQYTKNGRCTHTWGDGGLYEGWFVYHDEQKMVEAIDPQGKITFLYDENYRILQKTDHLGGVTKYEYDENGRITAIIDPEGYRTEYVYDRGGNVLKVTRPDGESIKTEYDVIGKPLKVTEPTGAAWKQEWNSRGLLSKLVTPMGAVSQYHYDQFGQLIGFTDPLGNTTKLSFDNYGNLISWTDAKGQSTEFTYNMLGQMIARIDPAKRRTSYQYDLKGRLVKAVLPGGATITCEYDPEDNLVAYRDENGAVTRLEYCGVNKLKRRIQPDGQMVEYEYNAEEDLVAVVNQRGERYELGRNAAGRIIEEVDYWGQIRKYSYSPAGHLQESIDPLGQVIRYQTDPLGRIVSKVLQTPEGTSESQSETFKYDANGNLIGCANRDIEVKRFFDLEGKLIREEQGPDASFTYTYDLSGYRTSRTTHIQYGAHEQTNKVNYVYDSLGQVTSVEIAGHQPIKINRNSLGKIVHETLGDNLKRWLEYDDAGRLTEQKVAAGTGPLFKQEYVYDKAGNLIRKNDSVFGTDKFYYDPMGRITKHIDPLGKLQQYLYDAGGNRLITRIDDALSGGHTFRWRRTGEAAGNTYRFERAGNLIELSGNNGTTEFFWDTNQRLVKSVRDGQITTYQYDPLGRRISKETNGVITRFYWDGDALLGDVRLQAGNTGENKGPSGAGLREWVYYPESFEPLAMVQVSGETTPTNTEQVYYYFNDPNGCPTRLINESGRVVWAALYDAWGMVKKLPVNAMEQPLRLQGQYFDGETGLYYNRFRYFCPAIGSFISQDPLGLAAGENVYAFAPNTLRWIDPLGLSCEKPPARRTQNSRDITLPNERAARREAIRRHGGQVSKPNNYTKIKNWDNNPNLRGPKGEASEFLNIKDLNGNDIQIDHHSWGHQFQDNNTFELPHYHGPNGEHISYIPGG